MNDSILTLNSGSSSLKFAVFEGAGEAPFAHGQADRIGADGVIDLYCADGRKVSVAGCNEVRDHETALRGILGLLKTNFAKLDVGSVGHRIVHGGVHYCTPVLLDGAVLKELETLVPFAPLHQPHNLAGVRAAMLAFPGTTQVGCFDTGFHRSHPFVNDTFALPRAYYDKGVRRYGFHGLSYEYVASEMQRRAPRLAEGRVIVAHLGSGASVCALYDGQSIASTMGFSALDGLPMGTRCGQLDPGVVLYLLEQERMTPAEISELLYKKSGLLGLSGLSNDMRALEDAGTPEAAQAMDYFVFRVQREFGAMAAALGGVDAIVFCGGIGENSRTIRSRVCERLSWIGVEIDHNRNAANASVISSEMSRIQVMVIKTNEELVIARAVRDLAVTAQRSVA
jgi:acetate kinase